MATLAIWGTFHHLGNRWRTCSPNGEENPKAQQALVIWGVLVGAELLPVSHKFADLASAMEGDNQQSADWAPQSKPRMTGRHCHSCKEDSKSEDSEPESSAKATTATAPSGAAFSAKSSVSAESPLFA